MFCKPAPGNRLDSPAVTTMFSESGGRYLMPNPRSSPMLWRIGFWNSRISSGSVRSKRR